MPIVVDGSGGVPGSVLTLTRLWLNDVGQPSDLVSLSIFDFTRARAVGGQVRTLANGRLRAVRQAWSAKSLTVQVRRPSREQLVWLDDHIGRPVTVRDPDGGKFVGTYFDLGYSHPVSGVTDISLTLAEVSSSEAV